MAVKYYLAVIRADKADNNEHVIEALIADYPVQNLTVFGLDLKALEYSHAVFSALSSQLGDREYQKQVGFLNLIQSLVEAGKKL